jgi:DegV family protein with EDD domain
MASVGYRAGMGQPVAVVTDSTAYLPPDLAASAALTVVPLTVVAGGVEGLEGIDVSPQDVTHALAVRRVMVTTSRPAPARFAEVYERLLSAGAPAVVSVHLSARLSGTYDAALLAAAGFAGRVAVVDSRSTGMGLGFPVLAACAAAGAGASGSTGDAGSKDLARVRDAAIAAAARTSAFFYVDTLEHLRRGGRIGVASALLGTALSVKPILHVADGQIVALDKVRTTSRALARLVDLAVAAAGDAEVDVAVHHLAAPQRAADLAERLARRFGSRMLGCHGTEVGAVVGAHVGPGMAAIVIHRRPTDSRRREPESWSCP